MKARHLPHFQLPDELIERIQWGLKQEASSLDQVQQLSRAVLDLSQKYIENQELSALWTISDHRKAYWAYYLPLNFLRLASVIEEAIRLDFFHELRDVVDFGCGPGTGIVAWDFFSEYMPRVNYHLIDRDSTVQNILKKMLSQFPSHFPYRIYLKEELIEAPSTQSLALFSYSLNETRQLPSNLDNYSHLLILEPSTRHQGRQLMKWRQELIDKGYFIWAPCTHQMKCPLETKSKSDWCHDRILLQRPDWLVRIEDLLPLNNRSLTFSYLLASRSPPAEILGARVIGDTLTEKGKTRQALCRGPEREFLAWLKREGRVPVIARGSKIDISDSAPTKGNEVRIGHEYELLSAHGMKPTKAAYEFFTSLAGKK